MNFKDEYEKFYLEISKDISLVELVDVSEKYKEILSFTGLNSLEELELFFKVQNRQYDIVQSSLDKWEKGQQPSDKELRGIISFVFEITSKYEGFKKFKEEKFVKFANKEKEVDNLEEKATKIGKKFVETLIQHEKERLQPSQNQSTKSSFNNPRNQNQPSDKDNYPWGIIISMGVAMATLLGVIIFLLVRKKNKKNE